MKELEIEKTMHKWIIKSDQNRQKLSLEKGPFI
jgi:hypothetical protein